MSALFFSPDRFGSEFKILNNFKSKNPDMYSAQQTKHTHYKKKEKLKRHGLEFSRSRIFEKKKLKKFKFMSL